MSLVLEVALGIILAKVILVVSRKVYERWKQEAAFNAHLRFESAKEDRYWEAQHKRGEEAAARLDAWLAEENTRETK
jgi:hypothetical protein